MEVYESGRFGVTSKDDERSSPLTLADLAANRVIIEGLSRLSPQLPVLSEECREVPYAERSRWERFWLVDPLDGTKEFLKRSDEFTVNIALVEGRSPVFGVVFAPARSLLYYGLRGRGAFRVSGAGRPEPIRTAPYEPGGPIRIVASRSHRSAGLDAFLQRLGDVRALSIGSSLKFCLVAEGSAHLYPRLGPTMEWDTAAAQAVVEAAGGLVTDLARRPLACNKPNLLNPSFMASGVPSPPWWDHVETKPE
ncbi:MAG TPA: 3'(2'),5'-bisphosphate nucleotidase [Deltaproteobacteria bacterium]|nr:3'(2'),5'-bisphosphate nucleotidase [Deltaproteobacteria bacterium]